MFGIKTFPPPFADDKEDCIHVIVETPRGSRNKFAYDPDSGFFTLKMILPAGVAFPLDFGFIPGTKGEDGDPLDVLVLMEQSTYPGCLLKCRLIGIIKAEQKDAGETEFVRNDRLLAVPDASSDFSHVKDIADFGVARLDDITHFFEYYRKMHDGEFRPLGTGGKDDALALVKKGLS